MNTQPTTTTYKNRTYRLLWLGATKYGRRAHLQFLDGSGDFWVGADLVSAPAPKKAANGYCAECGAASARLVSARDADGNTGLVCPACARGSRSERSFS
jgi:hypothetical protein